MHIATPIDSWTTPFTKAAFSGDVGSGDFSLRSSPLVDSGSDGKTLETHMKRKEHPAIPLYGDRHLLAEPVARLSEDRTPYFTESRRWHPSVVAGALLDQFGSTTLNPRARKPAR